MRNLTKRLPSRIGSSVISKERNFTKRLLIGIGSSVISTERNFTKRLPFRIGSSVVRKDPIERSTRTWTLYMLNNGETLYLLNYGPRNNPICP